MKLLDFLGLAPVSGRNDYLKSFKCDVYNEVINIAITNDINRVVKKQLKHYEVPEIEWEDYLVTKDATAAVINIDINRGSFLFLVMRNDCTVDELVHESVHLAERILWERSIFHTPETSEVWAYFIQYLFDKIIDIFNVSR